MPCPHCAHPKTRTLTTKTAQGYEMFQCPSCNRKFNQRTNTHFNHLEYPTDIVLLVVMWRLRYKLSLRNLAEMFLERGFTFTHEPVRNWEARFAPLITTTLRDKRKNKAGPSWRVDKTPRRGQSEAG